MTTPDCIHVDRRTVLKSALAAAAVQLAPAFIRQARGEAPLRIGMVDPMTGVYAAVAQNEVTGARLAVAQINARAASSAGRSSCWWKTRPTTSAPASKRRAS